MGQAFLVTLDGKYSPQIQKLLLLQILAESDRSKGKG